MLALNYLKGGILVFAFCVEFCDICQSSLDQLLSCFVLFFGRQLGYYVCRKTVFFLSPDSSLLTTVWIQTEYKRQR